jgi:hypothetical protein
MPMRSRLVQVGTAVLLCARVAAAQSTAAQSTAAPSGINANASVSVASLAVRAPLRFAPLPASGAPLFADAPQDTVCRKKAVTYSDWYGRRLTVHRHASYMMLPLFVAEYLLGDRLIKEKHALYAGNRFTPVNTNVRRAHAIVAGGASALVAVNTTTGLWNLFDARRDANGRTRRTVHAIAMLVSDAGFAYTGVLGARAKNHGVKEARNHQTAALASFGVATAGASYMWFGR